MSVGHTGSVTETTLYDRVGGRPTFDRLVEAFYEGVAQDPPLRALYPEEHLAAAADRLRLFLEQYFGGPTTYQEQRGHPRLRMRHVAFQVTPEQRDRWLHHMLDALDSLALPEADAADMRDYFVRAAHFMVNTEAPVPFGDARSRGPQLLAPRPATREDVRP